MNFKPVKRDNKLLFSLGYVFSLLVFSTIIYFIFYWHGKWLIVNYIYALFTGIIIAIIGFIIKRLLK